MSNRVGSSTSLTGFILKRMLPLFTVVGLGGWAAAHDRVELEDVAEKFQTMVEQEFTRSPLLCVCGMASFVVTLFFVILPKGSDEKPVYAKAEKDVLVSLPVVKLVHVSPEDPVLVRTRARMEWAQLVLDQEKLKEANANLPGRLKAAETALRAASKEVTDLQTLLDQKVRIMRIHENEFVRAQNDQESVVREMAGIEAALEKLMPLV